MEKRLVMPEKCLRCGEMFDLNYDLGVADGIVLYSDREPLCWKCRSRNALVRISAKKWNLNSKDIREIELVLGEE